MTRILAFALAALAFVAGYLYGREVEESAQLDARADEMDAVQPADPVTLGPGTYRWVLDDRGRLAPPTVWPSYGTGDFWPQPWVNTSDTLEPLTAADRDWLDQTVRSHLYPST